MKHKSLQIILFLFFYSFGFASGFAQLTNMIGTVIKDEKIEIRQFTTYGVLNVRANWGKIETVKSHLCIGSITETPLPSPKLVAYYCDGHFMAADNSRSYADLLLAARTAEASVTFQLVLQKLEQIEYKISANTNASEKTRESIEQINKNFMEQLQKSITKRFNNLPAEILYNQTFKEEIEKLKNDIIKEIEKKKQDP